MSKLLQAAVVMLVDVNSTLLEPESSRNNESCVRFHIQSEENEMRLILTYAMVAPLMLSALANAQDNPAKIDAKKLVGKWKATDEKTKAVNTLVEFMADGKMSVTADFDGKTFVVPGTYKVDGNKLLMKTKIRDLEMDDEAVILQLTGDVLVTETKNGKKLNFERVKAKEGDGDDSKKDQQALQGTWSVVEVTFGGVRVPKGETENGTFVFEGDKFIQKSGKTVDKKGVFQLHAGKKPRAIDLVEEKGEKLLGIYVLEGKTLKICAAPPPAQKRPSEFTSTKENGCLLIILERAK